MVCRLASPRGRGLRLGYNCNSVFHKSINQQKQTAVNESFSTTDTESVKQERVKIVKQLAAKWVVCGSLWAVSSIAIVGHFGPEYIRPNAPNKNWSDNEHLKNLHPYVELSLI